MNQPHATIQTIVAALAFCISVLAAFFAWQQVEVTRVHNRLSVAPRIHIVPYAEGKTGRNGLYVANVGLGPAVITQFSVKSATLSVSDFESDHWPELLAAAGINPLCFATGWPKYQSVIKAGEELPLLHLTKADGGNVCYPEIIKLIGGQGIAVAIQYESIYGESKAVSESSRVNSKTVQQLYQQLVGK